MSVAIDRVQFLRGNYSGKNLPIRPPWSDSENKFTQQCNVCGECIKKCPTQIIHKGRAGYPVINFNAGECLFCGDCVDACKTDALSAQTNQAPWSVSASINTENCLAYNNTECRSCYDPCEVSSIKISAKAGGISIPTINSSSCTGCGACFSVCPTRAISMSTH